MYIFLYSLHGLMGLIGILHIRRTIGPNHFVGIRIGKTLGNEQLWYEVHVFAGWSMLITSVVSVVFLASVQLYQRYLSPDFPAEMTAALGATVLLVIGDGVIPLVHVLRVPEDCGSTGSQSLSDVLGSDYAIAVYMLLSVIMMASSLPGAFGRIAPNSNYGFRTAKTLSSEALWYASNRFAGWATIIAGLGTIGGLIALRFGGSGRLSRNGYMYLLTYLVPTVVSIAVSMVYVYWFL